MGIRSGQRKSRKNLVGRLAPWAALALFLVGLMPATPAEAARKGKKKAKAKAEETEAKDEKWNVAEPPGESRTIVIDTDETTWTNLDVSPDGETIVFDMLGDIYSVPITGGEARALTHGVEWSYQPRFSPDGARIAYISDQEGGDNLWLMDADGGNAEALTSESENLLHNPAWSPDGQYLVARKAFVSARSIPAGELWLFHASGGGGMQLVERPFGKDDQKNIAEPFYSPDGHYLYYSQDVTPGRVWQYNKDATGQIFVIQRLDMDTGETEQFVGGAGGAIRPTPSPDGKHLAFVRRLPGLVSALYLKDLESGKEWPIYDQFERDHQETSGSEGNAPAFAWTPDSESIVFWTAGKLNRVDVASREASVIPIHVRVEKKIQPALRVPVEVSPEAFEVKMPRWTQYSPDGSRVAFQAVGYLWLKDVASGETERLTDQSEHFEFYPRFSPDGSSLVYTTWDDQDLGSVRVRSLTDGSERVITPERGHYVEPRFSPDGKKVVYRKFAGGFLLSSMWSMEPGIYVVDLEGGEPERIQDGGVSPQLSPDGERLYYVGFGDGLTLESVNLAGHDKRTHLAGSKSTEISLSPDGRWVAFTEGYTAYVMPFPRTAEQIAIHPNVTALPLAKVSARAGDFLHWSAGSDRLSWSHGATLYSRDLKDAFAFLEGAPEELPEPVEEGFELGLTLPSDRPEGVVALVGGRVVTMRDGWDREEVIEDGTVIVEGSRIVAVGERGEVEVPAGAAVFDVAGHTVIPGLIDVHAHGAAARAELNPQQNWAHYSSLAFGVTTVHDPSNDTSSIFSAAELQRAGGIVAPRIYSTGSILYGGKVPGLTVGVSSYEDALFHVRRMRDVGAISVKSYQLPRRDQRQQIVAAGRELGVMVVPEGGMKFQHNLNEIVDGHTGIEHSLTVKHAYEDVLQLWGQTEVGYTPTYVVSYGGLTGELWFYDHHEVWKNERLMSFTPRFLVEPRSRRRPRAPEEDYNHFHVARLSKQLLDRGVSVHIGAHGQREGLAAHWEMWIMEQGGFTPWEALRAGTLGGAWYVGLDGDLGSIEVGKLADLVVIEGNPLEDLSQSEHIRYTVLGGRVYDAATMNQLAPEAVDREPFFFELEGGDMIHPSAQAWLEGFQHRHGCQH